MALPQEVADNYPSNKKLPSTACRLSNQLVPGFTSSALYQLPTVPSSPIPNPQSLILHSSFFILHSSPGVQFFLLKSTFQSATLVAPCHKCSLEIQLIKIRRAKPSRNVEKSRFGAQKVLCEIEKWLATTVIPKLNNSPLLAEISDN